METFKGYGNFKSKLEFGNKFEELVCRKLQELGYDSRLTPQDKDNRDSELGNCDVVIYEFGKPILGIELKLMKEPYRISPYGDNNIPLNKSSIDTYNKVSFPIYILAGQLWTGNLFSVKVSDLFNHPYKIQTTKYKDTPIYNFDGSNFHQSHSLNKMIDHILHK